MIIRLSVKEQTYETLKKMIISGRYEIGAQLKEEEIAKEFNVSRSPVRNAFSLLVNEGLLEQKANRGVFVREITEKMVDDLIEIRILFERQGIYALVSNEDMEVDKVFLSNLKNSFIYSYEIENYEIYSNTDFLLHQNIVSYSTNEISIDLYEQLYNRINMYRNIALKNHDRFKDSYNEHIAIIDALLEEDFDKAWLINRAHLIDTGIEIKEALSIKKELMNE